MAILSDMSVGRRRTWIRVRVAVRWSLPEARSRSTTAGGRIAPVGPRPTTHGKRSSRSPFRISGSSRPLARARSRPRTREARSLRPVPLARARIPPGVAEALRDPHQRCAPGAVRVGQPDLERLVRNRAQLRRDDGLAPQHQEPRAVAGWARALLYVSRLVCERTLRARRHIQHDNAPISDPLPGE